MHDLWFHYVVPSLYGNGPEDLISLVIVGAIGALLWPPTRRWAAGHWQHFHAKLDHNAVMLRHIIDQHPDIDSAILDQHPLPKRGHKPK